jgi:hypothetical protein
VAPGAIGKVAQLFRFVHGQHLRDLRISHVNLISDNGGQFVADPFRRTLARTHGHHKFGSLFQRSSSMIETLWRILREVARLKEPWPAL